MNVASSLFHKQTVCYMLRVLWIFWGWLFVIIMCVRWCFFFYYECVWCFFLFLYFCLICHVKVAKVRWFCVFCANEKELQFSFYFFMWKGGKSFHWSWFLYLKSWKRKDSFELEFLDVKVLKRRFVDFNLTLLAWKILKIFFV